MKYKIVSTVTIVVIIIAALAFKGMVNSVDSEQQTEITQ